MSKKESDIPADALTSYDALIASHPTIERKGKTMPYTSHNGHMFSHLSKEGEMGLRLSVEDREQFLIDHQTSLFEQHGRVLKEFVLVPDALLHNTDALRSYLDKSFAYVDALPPKGKK